MRRVYYKVSFTSSLDSPEAGRTIMNDVVSNSDASIWTRLSTSGLWQHRTAVSFFDGSDSIIENQYDIDDTVYTNLTDGIDDVVTGLINILESSPQISSAEITITDI